MATGFVILLIVVGVGALLAWPLCIRMARRANEREQAPVESLRGRPVEVREEYPHGTVMGGSHVGGGRSVGPRRDEEVIPLEETPRTGS